MCVLFNLTDLEQRYGSRTSRDVTPYGRNSFVPYTDTLTHNGGVHSEIVLAHSRKGYHVLLIVQRKIHSMSPGLLYYALIARRVLGSALIYRLLLCPIGQGIGKESLLLVIFTFNPIKQFRWLLTGLTVLHRYLQRYLCWVHRYFRSRRSSDCCTLCAPKNSPRPVLRVNSSRPKDHPQMWDRMWHRRVLIRGVPNLEIRSRV